LGKKGGRIGGEHKEANKGMSKHSNVFSGQTPLYRHSIIRWHVVLMQNLPISPQWWPFPSHLFTQCSHACNIIVLIDNLVTGNPLCHHNTLDIEENNQHVLEV
jgi:hypothetical protein